MLQRLDSEEEGEFVFPPQPTGEDIRRQIAEICCSAILGEVNADLVSGRIDATGCDARYKKEAIEYFPIGKTVKDLSRDEKWDLIFKLSALIENEDSEKVAQLYRVLTTPA